MCALAAGHNGDMFTPQTRMCQVNLASGLNHQPFREHKRYADLVRKVGKNITTRGEGAEARILLKGS